MADLLLEAEQFVLFALKRGLGLDIDRALEDRDRQKNVFPSFLSKIDRIVVGDRPHLLGKDCLYLP
jgi:hypothetical protein